MVVKEEYLKLRWVDRLFNISFSFLNIVRWNEMLPKRNNLITFLLDNPKNTGVHCTAGESIKCNKQMWNKRHFEKVTPNFWPSITKSTRRWKKSLTKNRMFYSLFCAYVSIIFLFPLWLVHSYRFHALISLLYLFKIFV